VFYCNLRCVETCSVIVHYTYSYCVGPKFAGCFVFHVGHFIVSNLVLWVYSVRQRSYKQNVLTFRISFVLEGFITIHRMNIVLGHTIENT